MYKEDELFMISGIQHFVFCPRQWSLIHVEQEWMENSLTVEGKILHKNVDDPKMGYRREDTVKVYAMPIVSYSLGVYGVADCIELIPLKSSSTKPFIHPRHPGYWEAQPVEFKHGKPKNDNADRLQLMAQAICLEEMYGIEISEGSIYYEQIKHREKVLLDASLRNELQEICLVMHQLMTEKKAIKGKLQAKCRSCSLVDICMPQLSERRSVTNYINSNIWNSKL